MGRLVPAVLQLSITTHYSPLHGNVDSALIFSSYYFHAGIETDGDVQLTNIFLRVSFDFPYTQLRTHLYAHTRVARTTDMDLVPRLSRVLGGIQI